MKKYIDTGPYYDDLNDDEIKAACNGMGPEWMHESFRKKLDKLYYKFKESVEIHDVGYKYGTTRHDKDAEDTRMLWNMRKAAFYESDSIKEFFFLWSSAKACYIMVKYGGDAAFWYGKQKAV